MLSIFLFFFFFIVMFVSEITFLDPSLITILEEFQSKIECVHMINMNVRKKETKRMCIVIPIHTFSFVHLKFNCQTV